MGEPLYSVEEVEIAKAKIVRDLDLLRGMGINVVHVSRMPDTNRVRVVVDNFAKAEPTIMSRYGDIVYLVEGKVSRA